MIIERDKPSLKAGNFYFILIVLFFPFGLLFYNYLGIQFIDEIVVLFLTLYWITRKGFTKEFKILLSIFFFYLLYSLFYTKINGYIAPFYDLQQQIKPYIVILATLSLKPRFQSWQIRIIKKVIIFCSIILLVVYLAGEGAQFAILGHPASAAITSFTLGSYYLYFSDRKKKDVTVAMSIILCGLFSLKFKLFGEVCIFIGVYFFLKKKIIRLNLKYLICGGLLFACMLYIVWDKFQSYYIQGFSDESALARPILYKTSWSILCDYIPFGSGLGTFANEASRVFYSPIYEMYGIDNVWGLAIDDGAMFAADTFFPILAQYGFMGIFLFALFWKHIYMQVKNISNLQNYKIGLILLGTLVIESTSDSSMLSNRGVLIMILLGLCCNAHPPHRVVKRS